LVVPFVASVVTKPKFMVYHYIGFFIFEQPILSLVVCIYIYIILYISPFHSLSVPYIILCIYIYIYLSHFHSLSVPYIELYISHFHSLSVQYIILYLSIYIYIYLPFIPFLSHSLPMNWFEYIIAVFRQPPLAHLKVQERVGFSSRPIPCCSKVRPITSLDSCS
jgi:hypothetical protein